MKDYINIVLSKINKRQRELIAAELKGHLDDRINYYVNAGYDTATAIEKANEHMGETPELVGEQLEAMHTSVYKNLCKNIVGLFNLCALAVMAFVFLADRGFESFVTFGRFYFCSFLLVLIYSELLFSIKWKSLFFSISSLFMLVFYSIFTNGYNLSVFALYEIITGKSKAFIDMLSVFVCKIDSMPVYIGGELFAIFSVLLSIMLLLHIIKFRLLKNGKNYYKREKIIKIAVYVLIAFVISVTSITFVITRQNTASTMQYVDGFYFVESNEKVDPKTIENFDKNRIEFVTELFEPEPVLETYHESYDEEIGLAKKPEFKLYLNNSVIASADYRTDFMYYDDLNSDCSYKTYSISADFYTDKKYIMIVPFETILGENGREYKPDFKNPEWIDVSDGTAIESDREYSYYGVIIKYKIKLFAMQIEGI